MLKSPLNAGLFLFTDKRRPEMSDEVMTAEELKAMEEAMAAFLEEFRNPSRCDGANLRASVFPEKYHAVERELKAGRFMTTIEPEKETKKHIFLLHGGGFELEASMHCNVMMDLADRGFKVTAYDYPLAPEHQYKEINEAVYNAFKEFKTYYPDDKIALMGDSCGTSLSLTLMMRLRDEGDESRPKVAVWPSPAVDMAMDSPLMPIYEKNDPSLKLEVLYLCSERYAPERNWKDPLASPYYAEDMSRLGDAFIYYSSVELLRPDTEAFIKKFASFEGNTVRTHMCVGLFHDYVLQNELPESVYILDETAAFLNEKLD
jgi:acetyl esterase/lipase